MWISNNILKNKEKSKNIRVLGCFFKQCFILNDGIYTGYFLFFFSAHNGASVYFLALYQQVFLV